MNQAILILILAATLSGSVRGAGDTPPAASKPLEKTLHFRVLVSPQGQVLTATPLDAELSIAINRAALGLVKTLTIEPARDHGQAVQSRTGLTLDVRSEPQPAGGYRLALKSAMLMPQASSRVAPVYPPKAVVAKASALLFMEYVVLADGTVDRKQMRVLQATMNTAAMRFRAELETATIAALSQWRFEPDQVGDQTIATKTWAKVQFCLESCSETAAPPPDILALPKSLNADLTLAKVHAE